MITGGIASGKSYIGRYLNRFGFIRIDADAIVDDLIRGDDAKNLIVEEFGIDILNLNNKGINKEKLREKVLGSQEALSKLENILHPMVNEKINTLIKQIKKSTNKSIIVEMPLLFEKEFICSDITIATFVDLNTQKSRALMRKNMTHTRFNAIVTSQSRCLFNKSNFYNIDTCGNKLSVRHNINKIIKILRMNNAKRNRIRY